MSTRSRSGDRPARRPPLPIRIPAEMVDRIDALRPELVPREAFVRALLEKALEAEERKAKR